MKFSFSLKNKEASFEADVEGLVEKGLEHKAKNPNKKTRHQIRQEEYRKNEEMKHKQFILGISILLGISLLFLIIGAILEALGW